MVRKVFYNSLVAHGIRPVTSCRPCRTGPLVLLWLTSITMVTLILWSRGRKVKEMGNNYGLYLLQGDGRGGFKELVATNLPAKGLSVTWGVAVGDVNEDGLIDFVAATGGAVAGSAGAKLPPQAKTRPDTKAKKPVEKEKPASDSIAELPLPRMQAWVNEGVH